MKNLSDREIAKVIAKDISEWGGKTYFVGGFVRDNIMNKADTIKDVDIEIHNIVPDVVENIISSHGELIEHGNSFGVYGLKHHDLDIALPRKECSNGTRHIDFNVDVDPFIGEAEASKRRDFTINALMANVLTGKILDFHGGIQDIENKIIRHVDDKTFSDDALRVLRAAQFAARFGFTIDNNTIELCRNISLENLSKERIFGELEKALMKAEKPSIFFEELRNMDQLDFWFPEIKSLISVAQNEKHHKEGDVWSHTMMVLDEAAKNRKNVKQPLAFMLSALCHDFGKTICSFVGKDGLTHAYNHETLGLPLVESFMRRITNKKDVINYVLNMVELHQSPNQNADNKSKVKSTNKMFDKAMSPTDLVWLSVCDDMGRIPASDSNKDWLFERLDIYKTTMAQPFVRGCDLIVAGLQPDKSFTELLNYAHKLRLAGIDKPSALKQVLAHKLVL